MTTAKTLAKGTFWGVLTSFILKVFGWLYVLLIFRLFPQDDIGVFFWVFSVISLLMLFSDLGLGPGAVFRYIPFFAGKKEYNHLKKALWISITAGTFFSVVCMVAVMFFSHDLASFFDKKELVSKIVSVFYIMGFYLVVYNFYSVFTNFLAGRKLMRVSSYLSSLQAFFKVLLTVLLGFVLGFSADSLAWGFLLSYAFSGLFGLYWSLKEYRSLPASEDKVKDMALFREMVIVGLAVVVIMSLSSINSYIDRILLGLLLPQTEAMGAVAVYSGVISISSLILIIVGAIGGIFFPIISEFLGRDDFLGIEKASSTYFHWMALASPAILLWIIVFPAEILRLLLGESYSIGSVPLILYSLGLFVSSFSFPVNYILMAMKKQSVIIKILFVGTIVNLILNYVLIPGYGIDGAAFATLISYAVMTFMSFRIMKTVHITLPRDIYKPFVAAAVALIISLLLKPYVVNIDYSFLDVTQGGVYGDFLRKFIKAVFITGLGAFTSAFYLILLIALKAFNSEDAEIMTSALRRAKLGSIKRKIKEILRR